MATDILTPKGFLTLGGIAFILLAILGFVNFRLGPNGSLLNFDASENIAHLVLGLAALVLILFLKNSLLNKWVTIGVGAVALAAAVIGFAGIMNSTLIGAHFENPVDNVLHLVIGVWGMYSGLMAKKA